MSATIDDLPLEVLEAVFQNLDGVSFIICSMVCKSWYEVVGKMKLSKVLWKRNCTKEIPIDVLADFLSYQSVPPKEDIIAWGDIYKQWFCEKSIFNFQNSIHHIQAFYTKPISCIKLSGSFVITGHTNGLLCKWNLNSGKLLQNRLCHLKNVTDLALVDLLHLGSYYGLEEGTWGHHHLISVSKDMSINIHPLLEPLDICNSLVLKKHGDALLTVRIFGNHFIAASADNTITLWSMRFKQLPKLDLDVSLLSVIIGPRWFLTSLGFWQNKIFCTTNNRLLKVYDSQKRDWHVQEYFRKQTRTTIQTGPIEKYFLFRDEICVLISQEGRMVTSCEGRMAVYHVMLALHTSITSVFLKGTILALGGENGRIYLYHVPSSEALLTLNIAEPSLTATLSEASIICIDICGSFPSPVVVAATTESMYVVKWDR